MQKTVIDFSTVLLLCIDLTTIATSQIVFQVAPASQAIVYGQDLLLNCSVVNLTSLGKEGLSIQWNLNQNLASQRTSIFPNGTLLVPSVTENDLGNYTCIVLDSRASVILESPPAVVFHAFIRMFEVNPTPVRAIEGETVSFDCITGQSAPDPEIFWERNGERFTGGDQHNATYGGYSFNSLIKQYTMKLLLQASTDLDGDFNCVARNPVLKIDVHSVKVLLQTEELQSAPYVLNDLFKSEIITPEGQPMVIACPINGKPQVFFTWYKDNELINGSQDFFLVLKNGSLFHPAIGENDNGSYFCKGSNTLGVVTSPNISVTVARIGLEFIEEPEDLYAMAGLPATLHCTPPISVPTANVTWYKDDTIMVPQTGKQSVQVVKTFEGSWNIVFQWIQKGNEGRYFCVAHNEHAIPPSRTSSVATVKVGGAPIFIQPPVGLTVMKGKLVQLMCYVQGDPFPEVIWLFDKRAINVSETIGFRDKNQQLWIGNINKGNEGTYTCQAVNRYGSIQTSVYVKVLVAPVVLLPVGNMTASVGDTAILPCVVYSFPSPTITWFKNSAEIAMAGRITMSNSSLYIASVRVEDSGTYSCHAANVAGSVESVGTLEVLAWPYFIEEPVSQDIILGKNVTLFCVANGYPKPDLVWKFNGSSLFPQNTFLSLDNKQLWLTEVAWSHVGKYSCIAQNVQGMAIATASISIIVPPQVVSINGIPLLYENENLMLKCIVTGIPFPIVNWLFNQKPFMQSFNGRQSNPEPTVLNVKFVTIADAGVYSCNVTNTAGSSQEDIIVYIISQPTPPVLNKIETLSATSVMLSWTMDQAVPQTPVDKVLMYYRRNIETSSSYQQQSLSPPSLQAIVDGLEPATEYVFMLKAINQAGSSAASNILAAKTFNSAPSIPRNFQILDVKSSNVTLGWELPQSTNGRVKKYQIDFQEETSFTYTSILLSSDNDPNTQFMVDGLSPYTLYTLRVRAATLDRDQSLWGNWSNTLDVKTLQAAPTGTPRDVTAQPLSPDTILVIWQAVLLQHQNGLIKRYTIRYWLLSNFSEAMGEVVIESPDLQTNISGLKPWSWYGVTVTAENDMGKGEPSEPVYVRTLPTAPTSPPANVSAIALSSSVILVKWQLPTVSHWNSDLSGFIIQYWNQTDSPPHVLTSIGVWDLTVNISGLTPYMSYTLRIAAFTYQVMNGTGPYCDNITVTMLQSVPGSVQNVTFKSTTTALMLSWTPPTMTNGIIMEYLIIYVLVDPAAATIPISVNQPVIFDHASEIFTNLDTMKKLFGESYSSLSFKIFEPLSGICDKLLSNSTFMDALQNMSDVNQSKFVLQNLSMTNSISDWMFANNIRLGQLCSDLRDAALKMESDTKGQFVLNVTTKVSWATLANLLPDHLYNVSIAAASGAGLGPFTFIQATTLPAVPTTPKSSSVEPVSTTQSIALAASPLAEKRDNVDQLRMAAVIGGSISGLVLLLFIMLIAICIFLRRKRHKSEEKGNVLSKEYTENGNSMYGQLDRPGTPTAANGTEPSSIHVEEKVFHTEENHNNKGTLPSFVMVKSGRLPRNDVYHTNGITSGVYTIGLDDPSPNTKSQTTSAIMEPSASDMESLTVSLALSDDTRQSQHEALTLKRKRKMRNIDAAAIAYSRNSNMFPGFIDDKSSLINSEVEIVYHERTAL